ncbi:hypothetical protein H4R21_006663 [Coemansia helicoidea]|uniref:Uncharacterized protein n=1 Tax=Coemansia helicoidea TaxID=1286919 RepID=A0ACC1KH65_9FUNG|nr:hypothetical protein H4R21_006663 [Coemansia helicoidea]
MNPRTSMADAPRLPSLRTSSIDMLARSPQLPIAGGGGGSSTPDMSRLAAITTPRSNAAVVAGGGRPQHMPATPSRGTEYLVAVRVAGSRIEAALSQSLQTSVISMQLATALNMPVARMPPNSRVWSSGGKSWQVVGEVAAMPFACGNMTFTHNFKVVPGAAAAHDLTRDMVLGNDFCVGNKGRIKDNRLHLEKLAMPVSVAVRPVPAS